MTVLLRQLACRLLGHDLVPATEDLHLCLVCHTFKDLRS